MDTYDVLILTSEWVDGDDSHELRFYGRSEELGPVELIFDTAKPLFFVDREEILPAIEVEIDRKPVKLNSMGGRPVDALYFKTQRDLQTAADRFAATGVRHYEADVRAPDRFLMERFINGGAKVAGDYEQKGRLASFKNPKIKAAKVEPDLLVASIDIETGVSSGQLYSIAAHLTGGGKDESIVFMLADKREDLPEHKLKYYPTEKEMMQAFLEWFKEEDPDIIIGWHVIGFDLMYMERKCRDFGIELDLSRSERPILLTDKPGAGYFATISGRIVVDGPQTLRSNGFRFPNYKLETVAQSLLGAGKLIASDHNKVAEIDRQFREDKISLAKYNIEDCVLVTDIYNHLDLLNLIRQRSWFSGMLPDQLSFTASSFDHYYLPKLHRKGLVAPNSGEREAITAPPWDLEPRAGHYQGVVVLAVDNMYASLIRIFKIEPLAYHRADVETVTAPGGFRFSGSEHLLPYLLERLMLRQEEARKSKDGAADKATTVQLQNVCNILHSKACRFFNMELSNALQSVGQWLMRESQDFLTNKGYEVIRADEDAIFVALREGETNMPDISGQALAAALKKYWVERLKNEFSVESYLDIRYDRFYKSFLQPDGGGKRYAGMAKDLELMGMDDILSDWTELARDFMEGAYRQLLEGEEVDPWILGYANRLKEGDMDPKLAYRKRIRKDVNEYAKNAPPHIRAARMLDKPGREINYIFTKRGPVPDSMPAGDMDYEHYMEKQLKPVAEVLLGALGKTFKSVTEPEQISLF